MIGSQLLTRMRPLRAVPRLSTTSDTRDRAKRYPCPSP
jgi:hypothetical protein